jgi:hypothetical protein
METEPMTVTRYGVIDNALDMHHQELPLVVKRRAVREACRGNFAEEASGSVT